MEQTSWMMRKIGKLVLDSAYKVHTVLGPGLLESAYESCLEYELKSNMLTVERQKLLPLKYEEIEIAVDAIKDVHIAQILSYMKLGKYWLGYLINFNVKHLKQGIRRLVN